MQLKAVLPSGIAQAIESNATSKAQAQGMTRLAGYILRKYIRDGLPFDEGIEISKEHFRNQVNSRYLDDLKALRAAGIVSTNDFYIRPIRDTQTGERLALGQCKRHHFNPDLVFSDPELVTYNETARGYITGDDVTRATAQLLGKIRLSLDERNLARYVAGLVTPEYVRARLKIGEEIPPGAYKSNRFKEPMDRNYLIEIARKNGLDLVLYRENKCVITDAAKFAKEKRQELKTRYLASLIALKQARKRPAIYCSRNDTNRRLDTNLTALKSELLGLVIFDGEPLVSIDLKNSQFTLLAWVIDQSELITYNENENVLPQALLGGKTKEISYQPIERRKSIINAAHFWLKIGSKSNIKYTKSNDCKRFKKLTKAGKFYEDLAAKMSAADGKEITRAEAKSAMFLAAFSKHRSHSPAKKILAQAYPDLVRWMDDFKRAAIADLLAQGLPQADAWKQGDAALAVMLQSVESAIFIDGILADLLSRGLRVFSKHDSILCKPSDLDQVSAIIRDHLDAVLGIGGYQITISKT